MVLASSFNVLNIFLTNQCNLKCSYCFVNIHKDSNDCDSKELELVYFKKAIDFFLNSSNQQKEIIFSGGEPLLRFDKIKESQQYLQHTKRSKIKPTITVLTNGTLLNDDYFNFLESNGISLKVSIDGKKAIHDHNRPFKSAKHASSYEHIVNNLDYDKRHGVGVNLVFTPDTINKLLSNIKFVVKAGFGYVDFYPDLYSKWSEEELEKLESIFNEFREYYVGIFNNTITGDNIFKNNLLHRFINDSELYRPILCYKIHFDWEGNFYCCDKALSLNRSEKKAFIIGNAHKGIDKRLRSKLLEQKRNEIKNLTGKDCKICKYLKYCFCPIGQYIYFSSKGEDFKEYFPQFCRISQIYIRNFLSIKERLKSNKLFAKTYGSKHASC